MRVIAFVIVLVAAFIALLGILIRSETPITGSLIKLGTPGYAMKKLAAPTLHSTLLDMFTFVITKTPIGYGIRRFLLEGNGIAQIRELASQVHTNPVYFPVHRLNREERATYCKSAKVQENQSIPTDLSKVLGHGISLPVNAANSESSAHKYRSIMDYAAAYKAAAESGGARGVLPSELLQQTLTIIRSWEKGTSADPAKKLLVGKLSNKEKGFGHEGEGMRIFSSVIEKDVMAQAAASDARHLAGKPLSVFDGVPVAIKDSAVVRGHITYQGQSSAPGFSEFWEFGPNLEDNETEDEIMVDRLRSLGAVIIGITVMVEGGTSPLGWNSHYMAPFNPYHRNRYSGGSSSGSAVAVATGIVPVAVGYDGGGSIRLPACMSGTYGLAPTFGRVPISGHDGMTVVKVGPMAMSAVDTALLYAAMASSAAPVTSLSSSLLSSSSSTEKVGSNAGEEGGKEEGVNTEASLSTSSSSSSCTSASKIDQKREERNLKQSYSKMYDGGNLGLPPAHLNTFAHVDDLSDVRIGIFREWFDDTIDPKVQAICQEAVDYLKSRGATIVETPEIHIPHMRQLSLSHALRISAEFSASFDRQYHSPGNPLEPNSQITVGLGAATSAQELEAIAKLRGWAINHVQRELFEKHNLTALLTPMMGLVAPFLSEEVKLRGVSDTPLMVQVMRHAFLANFLGIPGYSVPVGFTEAPAPPPSAGTQARSGGGGANSDSSASVLLPVGLQILGNFWGEHHLLRLGHSLERNFKAKAAAPIAPKPLFFHDPLANVVM